MDSLRELSSVSPEVENSTVLSRVFLDSLIAEYGSNAETVLLEEISRNRELALALEKYCTILKSSDFQDAVGSEAVSYGMIKPHLEKFQFINLKKLRL